MRAQGVVHLCDLCRASKLKAQLTRWPTPGGGNLYVDALRGPRLGALRGRRSTHEPLVLILVEDALSLRFEQLHAARDHIYNHGLLLSRGAYEHCLEGHHGVGARSRRGPQRAGARAPRGACPLAPQRPRAAREACGARSRAPHRCPCPATAPDLVTTHIQPLFPPPSPFPCSLPCRVLGGWPGWPAAARARAPAPLRGGAFHPGPSERGRAPSRAPRASVERHAHCPNLFGQFAPNTVYRPLKSTPNIQPKLIAPAEGARASFGSPGSACVCACRPGGRTCALIQIASQVHRGAAAPVRNAGAFGGFPEGEEGRVDARARAAPQRARGRVRVCADPRGAGRAGATPWRLPPAHLPPCRHLEARPSEGSARRDGGGRRGAARGAAPPV